MPDTIRSVEATIDAPTYPAVERTMLDGIADGEIDPTIMTWTFDDELFLSLGPIQDSGLIDTELADERGVPYSRRFHMAGSVGFFQTDHTPTLYAFFPDEGGRTLEEAIALAGEAMAEALRDAGVDRVYYEGGDLELEAEEDGVRATKIGVAGGVWHNGVWGVFVNAINRNFSAEQFETIDELVRLPKVKFEDKDTDSVAGRMGALEDEVPGVDVWEVLDEARQNIAETLGYEVTEAALSESERQTIDEHRDYYGSSEWFDAVSTANLRRDADDDHRIAEVAYKARKLVKASVVVDDDDTIVDALYTGDMYHKPRMEAVERLSDAIVGHDIHDSDALLAALEATFAADDFEIPWMVHEDFHAPLQKVPENLTPVSEFGRE